MLRVLILFIFSMITLNALSINDIKNSYEFKEFMIYEDKENNSSLEKILNLKNEFKETTKTNLGIKKYPIWAYGRISNKTLTTLNLILANSRAGTDFIDVYIYKNNKYFKTYKLGDMQDLQNRDIQSRKSNFSLSISPNEEYELYIKFKSFGAIDIDWIAYEQAFYSNLVKEDSLKSGFIIGVLIIILLIVLGFIIIFPNISTVLFFLILLGSVLMQFSVSGILFEMGMNSYLNTITSWSFGNIAAAFIGLFPIYYFKLKSILPKTTFILKSLSGILILLSLSFLFYPLKNEILYLAPIANIQFFIISLILVFVAINLYMKKIDGHKIYAFGNGFFLLTVIYFISGLLGLVQTNSFFYNALSIGSLVNIFCLGILIFSNLLRVKNEKDEAMLLLNEYSKLSSVGQSMINLSHQWKEPLNHIYYAINNIQAAKEFKDPNFDKILEDSLKNIKSTASYMTNTGKNFLTLYEDTNYNETVNLRTICDYVFILFEKQINELNIKINLNIEKEISINTNKYLLSNVFMAIIENNIKIIKNRNIKKPLINITITENNNIIDIDILDNAGGIEIEPIESIFEKDLTNSKSTGLGLYLVKSILSLKLNGDIKAINTSKGACFKIELKK